MRILGIITALVIIEVMTLIAGVHFGNEFLKDFVQDQSLVMMSTLLGLNLVTATFILTHLGNLKLTIKSTTGKDVSFKKTITEIRHNVFLMLAVFIAHTCLLLGSYSNGNPIFFISEIGITTEHIGLFFFMLYLFAFYELTRAIFHCFKE